MADKSWNAERAKLVKAAVNNSAYYRHINMRLVDFNDNGSLMEMEIIPEHKNLWGGAHGGVIASLVDSSCGTAVAQILTEDETIVTLDLKVQYLLPVRGGKLVAKGRVVHRTRRFAHTESEIFDNENNMVARGGGIHAVLKNKGTEGADGK